MRVHEGVDEERGHAVDQQTGDDMLQDVSPDRRAVAEHDAMLTPLGGYEGQGRSRPAANPSWPSHVAAQLSRTACFRAPSPPRSRSPRGACPPFRLRRPRYPPAALCGRHLTCQEGIHAQYTPPCRRWYPPFGLVTPQVSPSAVRPAWPLSRLLRCACMCGCADVIVDKFLRSSYSRNNRWRIGP
jgi:hypothetical protein